MPKSPVVDDTNERLETHAIGNKGDTAATAAATDKSIMAYVKAMIGASVDWNNGERLDLILDTIAADAARLTAVRAATMTDWINGGRLDLLLDALVLPAVAAGEADIDIDQQDYTSFQVLSTIVPAAGAPLRNAKYMIDLAKASTGFAAGHAAETIQFAISRKIDGTAWRQDIQNASTAISGTNAAGTMIELDLGTVGVTEEVRVEVVMSAENSVDVEFPVTVTYEATAAPTITHVAAA